MADSGQALTGVRLAGIAAAVPSAFAGIESLREAFGHDEADRIAQRSGIAVRHIADTGTCTSDLCYAAASRLLAEMNWNPSDVDVLVFVSQTPDYILPATSCLLHGRLNLPKNCAAFDINLGCSGYVYGLWVVGNLLSTTRRRALLLVGDTISKIAAPNDRSVVPLFGDAGTATAIEWTGGNERWAFDLGTDGTGHAHLKVPAGGFRSPWSEGAAEQRMREDGNVRSDLDLHMDGAEVFAFTMREVKPLIRRILSQSGWLASDVDSFVFHQANQFMLQHLARQTGIPAEKLLLAIQDFGNTSSASIPLAIAHGLGERLGCARMRLILAGFGVGFSWGAAALETGPMTVLPVISV